MAEKKGRDPKMAALEQVYDALKDLDPADQEKVLTSLTGLLAIGGSRTQPAERGAQRTPDMRAEAASRPTSLIELMQDKVPQTNAQRIALFAYYRERTEGLSRFSRGDLKPYFGRAKVAPASNFDRDFGKAVRNGWIHEDGSDSYLTTKGIEAVESSFPTSGTGTTAKSRKRKTNKKSQAKPRRSGRRKS